MNVLHILGSPGYGGISRMVLALVNEQSASQDVEPAILLSVGEGPILGKLEELRVPLYSANLKSGFSFPVRKVAHFRRLFGEFEVIHFHGFFPFLAFCSILSVASIVYSVHGTFGFGRPRKMKDRIKAWWLQRFLTRYVDIVACNSYFTLEVAKEKYKINNVPHVVIYNGINLSELQGDSSKVDPGIGKRLKRKFVVGTSSHFTGVKRIDRLIEAFSVFQNTREGIALLLVGDGLLKQDYLKAIEQGDFAENVIFTGYRKNVHDYQLAMDVCVFPSQNEAFGLAALETLGLGKPTIVFADGGGLVEVVGGFSSEDVVWNIPDLVRRLEYYYERRMVEANDGRGREAYARRFSSASMAKGFLRTYRQVRRCEE